MRMFCFTDLNSYEYKCLTEEESAAIMSAREVGWSVE